jgi:hypothetical protein
MLRLAEWFLFVLGCGAVGLMLGTLLGELAVALQAGRCGA